MYRCFDELDDAVAILDRDSSVARLNHSFRDLFGIESEAVRGTQIGYFITHHLTPLFEEDGSAGRVLDALQHRREVSHVTCRMRTFSGDLRWFSFSCRVMAGEPYAGMMLVRFRDVTPERGEMVRGMAGIQDPVRAGSVYTAIGDLVPYGIWICEPDGTALHISASFLDLVGKTIEGCRQTGWVESIPIEDVAAASAEWKHCLDTGCLWDREFKIRNPGGGYRIILSRGAPVRDENGEIRLWAGINLDITARKRAECLTTRQVAQQAAIAELGQIALAGTEPPELMNAVVRTVARHLGVGYAKVLRYLPDGDMFVLEAAIGFDGHDVGTRRIEGGTNSQAGYTLLSREPVIVEDFRTETRFSGPALLREEGIRSGISVIIQGDRGPYGVLGAHTRMQRTFTRDDSNFIQAAANVLAQGLERRAAEEALRKSEEKFREIAQRSSDMIYTCYHDGGIAYISPAVEHILGYTPEELIGGKCRDYVSPLSLPAWQEGQKRVARGEPVEGLEVEFRKKDGTAAFVELNESPIIENGKVAGIQAVGRDITERKQYEQLRQQAFLQIERNIEQFAVLGDHIRQPLQVTLGRAELLDDDETAAIIREQVGRINEYIRQLDQGWVESRKVREFLRRHDLE
ncbi:PAS domain S-box protein [Methanoculleus sp.]|uniref:PAS domain S-box protein n=1 Tax=Methanoculleus sp. TaxID=90427 RepID=UPI0025F74BE9|nr:PAS domain S-box protein [Methanoculleus sp.]